MVAAAAVAGCIVDVRTRLKEGHVQKFTTLRGIAAPLMRANIDTDAIIAPI